MGLNIKRPQLKLLLKVIRIDDNQQYFPNYDFFRQFVVQGGEAGRRTQPSGLSPPLGSVKTGREARESGRLKLDWTNNTMRALSNFPVGNFKLLSNIFHQVVALSTSCRCCFTRYSTVLRSLRVSISVSDCEATTRSTKY